MSVDRQRSRRRLGWCLALFLTAASVAFQPGVASATHGGGWYNNYAIGYPNVNSGAGYMGSTSAYMDFAFAHIINSTAGTQQQTSCSGGPPSTCPDQWTSYIGFSSGNSGKYGGCAIDGTHLFPTSVGFPGSTCQSRGLYENTGVFTF